MAKASGEVKLPVIYDEQCSEYHSPGHPERPQRVLSSHQYLKKQSDFQIEWIKPDLAQDKELLLGHTEDYIKLVDNPTGDFDGDTAAHENIGDHARRSAGAALTALNHVRNQNVSRIFTLMRPPGHHATKSRAMGFCYFSNAAIVALAAQQQGFQKVGILDFDVHHGNGTEDVVLDKEDIIFVSTHQSPCYPGTGLKDEGKNCINYPIRPATDPKQYLEKVQLGIKRIENFSPDLLIVSAGFDAYRHDTIANQLLEIEDFKRIGKMVQKFSIPTLSLLEGGYSDDLPQLIHAYLMGWLT